MLLVCRNIFGHEETNGNRSDLEVSVLVLSLRVPIMVFLLMSCSATLRLLPTCVRESNVCNCDVIFLSSLWSVICVANTSLFSVPQPFSSTRLVQCWSLLAGCKLETTGSFTRPSMLIAGWWRWSMKTKNAFYRRRRLVTTW